MRILYVAKHNSGDNDDEGAIAYALEQLGHEVVKVQELRRHRRHSYGQDTLQTAIKDGADFCLFHKWETVSEIAEVARHVPCAFWYFDLISNDDDPTLAARMQHRRRWFRDVIQHCVTAFVTDGDWVNRWNDGDPRERVLFQNEGQNRYTDVKIHWLMQGADERFVGMGDEQKGRLKLWPNVPDPFPEVLFTGTRHHGRKREEHVAELERRYGKRFAVLGETRQTPRRHGRDLADIFAAVKVVVAPDGPCTDRYWSNRVYLTLGLGGFLMHPVCEGLKNQYPSTDLVYYADREQLYRLIDSYLESEPSRQWMRDCGLKATIERNLYRHRCQDLIRVMEGLL